MALCFSGKPIGMARGRAKAPSEKDPFAIALGSRIREARDASGFTQKKLGIEAKYDPIQLSRVETGDAVPRSDVLARIAAATKRPISFFYGEGSTRPTNVDEMEGLGHSVGSIQAAQVQLGAELRRLRTRVRKLENAQASASDRAQREA